MDALLVVVGEEGEEVGRCEESIGEGLNGSSSCRVVTSSVGAGAGVSASWGSSEYSPLCCLD